MRPRKQILLIGTNERELMALAYALNTKSWSRCDYAIDTPSAREVLRGAKYDLAVIHGDDSWVQVIRKKQPECRILMVETTSETTHADVRLSGESSTGEIIEMMRIMCSRKRGPKMEAK